MNEIRQAAPAGAGQAFNPRWMMSAIIAVVIAMVVGMVVFGAVWVMAVSPNFTTNIVIGLIGFMLPVIASVGLSLGPLFTRAAVATDSAMRAPLMEDRDGDAAIIARSRLVIGVACCLGLVPVAVVAIALSQSA